MNYIKNIELLPNNDIKIVWCDKNDNVLCIDHYRDDEDGANLFNKDCALFGAILDDTVKKVIEKQKTNKYILSDKEKEEIKLEIERQRIENINSYTQSIITKKYPLEKQSSANLGIYGDEYKTEMINFISNCINLSNEAIKNGTALEDINWSV